MLIAQWIVVGFITLGFLATGGVKLIRPRSALTGSAMAWTDDFSAPAIKLIGAVEVVGALGTILPLATGIAPILSPLAALGLVIVMIGAVVVHLRRRESPAPAIGFGLLALAGAVLGFLAL